ncbi:MAG: MerR family DNA-binding protein [Acidobacteria bacterium]|nr:MerR family DNA-binding protein [Acidobacteriota bacterium]
MALRLCVFTSEAGFWEKPARTASGYRVFDANVLDRLAFIKKAQTLGFSLNEIRHIIAESNAGESPCAEVREIVRRRLSELDRHLRNLRRYRKGLAETLKDWDEKGAADGYICGLIEDSKMKAEPTIITESALKRRKTNKN